MAAALLCGLACADQARLSALPKTLVDSLGLDFAEIEIVPRVGPEVRHSFPVEALTDETHRDGRFEFLGSLSCKLIFASMPTSPAAERFPLAAPIHWPAFPELAQRILACVLVQQHDRRELGHGFERLSDREWEVCRALEGVDSEKEIAAKLAQPVAVFTVHAHVKKIYLALAVTSRKAGSRASRQGPGKAPD